MSHVTMISAIGHQVATELFELAQKMSEFDFVPPFAVLIDENRDVLDEFVILAEIELDLYDLIDVNLGHQGYALKNPSGNLVVEITWDADKKLSSCNVIFVQANNAIAKAILDKITPWEMYQGVVVFYTNSWGNRKTNVEGGRFEVLSPAAQELYTLRVR